MPPVQQAHGVLRPGCARVRGAVTACLLACLACLLHGCGDRPAEAVPDAQVIVVGAGISGLSAAVEMGRRGVKVLVVDMNSVAGGHAVLAGGVALVGTDVQRQQGIEDTPDIAVRDWQRWTEDGDAEWSRYYASNSREMIYDWVSDMGVDFVRAAPSADGSVPRFHFTEGRAVHLVLPIYRTALALPNVSFMWNSHAESLLLEDAHVTGVIVKNLRSGETKTLRAPHVVLATGGFESNLERVLANWTPGLPKPERLLIGSAISATGSGHDMATAAGAALARIDRHYIYVNGVPDPRDPGQSHALTAGNDRALWVNASGERFTNETGYDKDILVDLLQQEPATYWMVFDEAARDSFGVRGAAWLKNPGEGDPILDDAQAARRANTLAELASAAGLPADTLEKSVQRFNAMVEAGRDDDFGRFTSADAAPPKIARPPYYAVQIFPMTRKNMGGVAIDREARVLNAQGEPVPGLYAVGELNGSLGINGKHGLDGMFLGPAILSGRLAGQSIAAATSSPGPAEPLTLASPATDGKAWQPSLGAEDLRTLLATQRDGYWHFQVSHRIVLERDYACTRCHSATLPFAPVVDRASRYAQTGICTNCH